jgi:Anti-sigma-K factor rskA/Putative zinc-finger
MVRSHEEFEALLGAYALDAVEPDEAAELSVHLETCPRCAAELAAHREMAALFAYGGQEAPQGIWDEIATRIHGDPPELRIDQMRSRMAGPGTRRGAGRASRRAVPWRWVAPIAAAAAVAIAVLGVQVAGQGHSPSSVATMADVQHALSANGSRKVVMRAPGGKGATLDAVITPSGTGYIYGERGMSALPDNRTYQLWGMVGRQLISYGLLGDNPKVVKFEAGSGVQALAVTDEVAAGVVVSHQTPTVVGDVS